MEKKHLKKIEKLSREFFKKTTFEISFEIREKEDGLITITAKTDEPQVLIGENGRTLLEFQKILGRILRKQTKQEFFLDLDINDYKLNKIQYLREMVAGVADRVALDKKEQSLFPMTSYERRIVHMELAKRNDVKTESLGEGADRRIIIKPA